MGMNERSYVRIDAEPTDGLPARDDLTPARRRLFATALRLFSEHGYHAVSVRDITDELGQQPGALYAHVESKQHLLSELVRIGVTEHRDRLRAAVLEVGADPEEQVRALVRAHVLVHLDYPELARLLIREQSGLTPAQQEAARTVTHETALTLLDIIGRGRELGVFGEGDDLLAVTAIAGMGNRLPEQWTPGFARTKDQIAETYAEYALRLLR
jgi:AcrR family transcriptional regulator